LYDTAPKFIEDSVAAAQDVEVEVLGLVTASRQELEDLMQVIRFPATTHEES
jgi:hypothetical protein